MNDTITTKDLYFETLKRLRKDSDLEMEKYNAYVQKASELKKELEANKLLMTQANNRRSEIDSIISNMGSAITLHQ